MKREEPNFYWDAFYRSWSNRFPSQFGALAATKLQEGIGVFEFGTGSGRDALHLARKTSVIAVDASAVAIDSNSAFAEQANLPNIVFAQMRLASSDAWHSEVDELMAAKSDISTWICYARFFLHAIPEDVEDSIIRLLANSKKFSGGMFEFRNSQDASTRKVHGEHYRRYIEHDGFREKILSGGFQISMETQGRGLAYYRGEDPFVSRFICRRSGDSLT
jgi:SAM-dependent methyltransferase